ncbi:hypothetical protein IMZ48_48230 [Candidatus Bathyarchaeota archaeon]|nr:hypothetical protein [Candidatus Bathyarchaeota archaeon]
MSSERTALRAAAEPERQLDEWVARDRNIIVAGGSAMTRITQPAAQRRFHQGLHYILGMTDQGRRSADPEELLAVTSIMGYLAAYAFPDCNLYDLILQRNLAPGNEHNILPQKDLRAVARGLVPRVGRRGG